MASPTPPYKTWLMLGLAVLLLHLSLLQNLPLHLGNLDSDTHALSFVTRTLTPDPAPVPEPVRQPVVQPPPQPSPNTNVVSAQPAANAPAQATQAPAPTEASSAESPASTPQEVATDPAPPHPDEVAAAFSVDSVPGSVKLIYKVLSNKFPYKLDGELIWQLVDGRYEASLSFGAFGQTRIQTSRGRVEKDGLAPTRFSDKYRSEVAAHFNPTQSKVTFSANTPDVPLLSGAQDRLSVLVQLAAMAASAPARFTPGTTLSFQTVGPRDADMWLFTVGQMESLDLPGGQLQGIKLTRNPRQTYDQKVDIWLAPALNYLPARIRIQETNGDYIDQQWAATETP